MFQRQINELETTACAILGANDRADVNKKYRDTASICHPDHGGNAELMKFIGNIKEYLGKASTDPLSTDLADGADHEWVPDDDAAAAPAPKPVPTPQDPKPAPTGRQVHNYGDVD